MPIKGVVTANFARYSPTLLANPVAEPLVITQAFKLLHISIMSYRMLSSMDDSRLYSERPLVIEMST